MKSIKNLSFYLLPSLVGSILPIITLPIFTRILSVDDYGIYALSLVYATFVSGVSNFGLTIGYERNFFENKDKSGQSALLFSTLTFVVSAFLFFGLITYLFKNHFAKWIIGNEKYGSILFWAYCAIGITSLKTYYLTYFKNTDNAKAYAWYTIDESVLSVVCSLIFVVYLKVGVVGLVWGQLLAASVVFVILTINFKKKFPFTFNSSILKDSLKISLPLTPRIFFGVIGNQFDKYMIGLLGTLGGVGIYNLAQRVSYIVFNYMNSLQNVYSPTVYRKMFDLQQEQGGNEIGKYLTKPMYFSIAGALAVSLFSEELIIILTPVSYHASINIVSILSLLYATYFFGKQPQLIFAKKTMITSWLTLTSILLNIVINIPFINIWGAIGAAYGTLISGIISGAISFFISQKYYEIKWEYKKLLAIYLSLFLFTFSLILLREIKLSYILILVLKILFTSCYVILGFKMGILTKDMFSRFRNLTGIKNKTT